MKRKKKPYKIVYHVFEWNTSNDYFFTSRNKAEKYYNSLSAVDCSEDKFGNRRMYIEIYKTKADYNRDFYYEVCIKTDKANILESETEKNAQFK